MDKIIISMKKKLNEIGKRLQKLDPKKNEYEYFKLLSEGLKIDENIREYTNFDINRRYDYLYDVGEGDAK
jgi:hypothetical protein